MTDVLINNPSKIRKIRGKYYWREISKAKQIRNKDLWLKVIFISNKSQLAPYLAISVSKKYGNAVKRNKFKRRIKSCVRELLKEGMIPKNTVLLVGVKTHIEKEIEYKEVKNSLSNMIQTALKSQEN